MLCLLNLNHSGIKGMLDYWFFDCLIFSSIFGKIEYVQRNQTV
jgi:hypothetical protein